MTSPRWGGWPLEPCWPASADPRHRPSTPCCPPRFSPAAPSDHPPDLSRSCSTPSRRKAIGVIAYKLNRLFNPGSGRLLDVAVDHGFFGEPAFLHGIADMTAAID